jgi:hypothetical protein
MLLMSDQWKIVFSVCGRQIKRFILPISHSKVYVTQVASYEEER